MSVIGFPLLLIPLAICNIIVFLMPGVLLTEPVATLTLMSGVPWLVTLGDALLALGIVLLLFEVVKGARPGGKYLTDHLLSLVVFAGAAAEFVMLPQFGSSTYFMLTLLALVDFLSGFALRARRPARAAAGPSQDVAEAAEARESRVDPAPASLTASVSLSQPADASAAPAGPVPQSAPESAIVHGEAAGMEPHPDVPGPGIQPGGETPTPSDQSGRQA
ncbi:MULTISPECIES: hypothetical protein [unclassified Nitrobacter]|uniref:hypothetical protein n=1 Tax=unclassified Nitrobacter TaxID=2620411 RepID=UPI0002EF1396|nr:MULTISPECIES: hypothetical protein [unclassified Nitrobacter]MCB1392269.1 hypothetical protein [Nitrobacter sp.]MCV0385234.1 hypothetical protein [Nitrobacter sp.]